MPRGDGDGWVECGDGQRRWGRFGAAGLLVRAPGPDPADPLVLLQLRVGWSHHGGTWGLPGGARDSDETAERAALREAEEETAVPAAVVGVRGQVVDDLGGDPSGWTYTTVVGDVASPLGTVRDRESEALAWVAESEVGALDLHPGLRAGWGRLRAAPARLVVDAANVVGSVPDGWWRDRAGATTRVLERLARAVPRTVQVPGEQVFLRVAEVVAVVEGRARLVDAGAVPGVEVIPAAGPGDDAVVAAVREPPERADAVSAWRTVVATTDRELIGRLPAGTVVLGARGVRSW